MLSLSCQLQTASAFQDEMLRGAHYCAQAALTLAL